MRRGRNIPTKQSFAVVVDGETEYWYLEMFKRNEPNIPFKIRPQILQKKNIDQQYKLVTELSEEEYDKVFWIVDLDVLLKEEREKNNSTSSLQKFLNYYKNLSKQKKIVVIVNNPCLEYWFLLHFQMTDKVFTACTNAEKQVSQHLKGYEKTEKFFKKSNNDIYKQLKPHLQKAINNATALGSFDTHNHSEAMCEMPLLFQALQLL
ncbi:RloB family protein [Capnocytophaga leadbetteri]|mgnify:FL=1|uniref:RloB family protein n=1 Tax=Capnocytophaga leadbetteri TaxID=327575 RepID=UPI0028891CC9|nr:RloB family protein [Capnocytophaga leadbetteri]